MLDHCVKMYIPTHRLAEERDDARYIAAHFWNWFGGATQVPAVGYWGKETLVDVDMAVVYSHCTLDGLCLYLPSVRWEAKRLCRDLGQESIALEIDGALEFIGAE